MVHGRGFKGFRLVWAALTECEVTVGNFFTAADGEINGQFISIDKANLLLRERGVVVVSDDPRFKWTPDQKLSSKTHVALLINITPIEEEDTAEGLLREIIGMLKLGQPQPRDLLDRLRKLLSRGEK